MRRIHWLIAVLILLFTYCLAAVSTPPWGGQRAAMARGSGPGGVRIGLFGVCAGFHRSIPLAAPTQNTPQGWGFAPAGSARDWSHYAAGIGLTHRSSASTENYGVLLPWWLLLALAGAPCLWRFDKKAKRRVWQLAQGLCLHCGYDLRASRERCPECGTPVPAGHTPKVTP